MVKYIIEIQADNVDKIRNLIAVKRYKTIPEFASIAIENQLMLEESNEDILPNSFENPVNDSATKSSKTTNLEQVKVTLSTISTMLPNTTVNVVPLPDSNQITNGPLWGQYNKLLPIKLALRVLMNRLNTKDGFVPLSSFQDAAADIAREIGLRLIKYESEIERPHGEKFSAGLPVGKDEFKTKLRFKNQFIGYMNKNDLIEGAIGALSFINMKKDSKGDTLIGLTEQGLQFASITNPILDNNSEKANNVLSNEEINFYLKHIKTYLPSEAEITQFVINNIYQGINKPDALTTKIKEWNTNWSDDVANTMRSGIISRLFDLRLIQKEKEGLFVTYHLTKEGEQYVRN